MIKSAQSYHIKDIVRLCGDYYKISPYVRTHTYDADYFLNTVRRNIISPTAEVAVAEWAGAIVGFSVAYLGDYMWTQGLRVNMELIYVDPDQRQYGLAQGLLDHNIAWARSHGAKEFLAGDIGITPDTISRFYQLQGFEDPGVIIRRVL